MSMMVQTSTDEAPELLDVIERRRASGRDRFDEWWEGVYRIVTGPSPEHGKLILTLGMLLVQRAEARGLDVSTPLNIGLDKRDARVPDIGVYRPDTERTSPAFLSTAELVVEILSPGEKPGEKLPFYAAWNVKEYLEIDPTGGDVRLLTNTEAGWEPCAESTVLDLTLGEVEALVRP